MPPAALISSAASSIAWTLTMVAAAKSPDWSSRTPILIGSWASAGNAASATTTGPAIAAGVLMKGFMRTTSCRI
jgi:hypothetical protein